MICRCLIRSCFIICICILSVVGLCYLLCFYSFFMLYSYLVFVVFFFFSSRRRHTRCALVTGVQTCALPIFDPDRMRPILAAVRALRDAGPTALAIDHTQEDLYAYVERHIVHTLGVDVGGRLHTGRSRNDLNVTVWRMALRDALLALLGDLGRFRATLLDRAAAHADTVMPGYTHSQHEQPFAFGYCLLGFADSLARDFPRLRGAL